MDQKIKNSTLIISKFAEFKDEVSKNINAQEQMEDAEDEKEEAEFTKALAIAEKQNKIRNRNILESLYGKSAYVASTLGFVTIGVPVWLIAEIGNVLGKFVIGLSTGFRRSRRKIWKMMNSFKTELNSEMLSQIKDILEENKNRDRSKDSGFDQDETNGTNAATKGGSIHKKQVSIKNKIAKRQITMRSYT
ncbi:MAG: hypothetical protein EBU93_07480 [Chlamydiae bacterium]|nr:hypothetical protein [Chlamydiota bacterium]